jgi:Flp pilus assembly protein TadD
MYEYKDQSISKGSRCVRILALGAALVVLAGCVTTNEPIKPVVTPQVKKTVDPAVLDFAEKAIDQHRYSDAAKMLQRVFINDPDNSRAKLLFAEVVLATGSHNEALQRFSEIAEKPDAAARALQGKGLALILTDNADDGHEALVQAVAKDAGMWRAWNALGYYYDTAGDWQKSSEAYDNALKANPNSALIYNNRGYSRLLQKNLDGSINDLRTAMKLDPKLKIVRLNLRIALAWKGKYARAMLGVQKKERGKALNNIGYIALLRGDLPAAQSFFLRALEADAAYNATAYRNLSYLENLKEVQNIEAGGQTQAKAAN